MLTRARMMSLPDQQAMGLGTRLLADRLASLFRWATPGAMVPVVAWLESGPVSRRDTGRFKPDELVHDLSPWMAPHVSETAHDGRSLVEFGILRAGTLPAVDDVLAGGEREFVRLILQMHEMLMGESEGFRSAAVGSVPDRKGEGVVYPSPNVIPDRVQAMWNHWLGHVELHPGFAAVVAMTALMNLHPFMDGNGRVARLLFHWTLNRDRVQPVYLPIHELSALSECGYLIRLRQAQYHDEWEPLLAYLVMVAERLAGDPAPHVEHPG